MAHDELPADWHLDEARQRLVHERKEKDFLACVAIIQQVADVAEDLNHHPDVHLEGYNTLRIETYTHTEGRVTGKDHELARAIAERLGA